MFSYISDSSLSSIINGKNCFLTSSLIYGLYFLYVLIDNPQGSLNQGLGLNPAIWIPNELQGSSDQLWNANSINFHCPEYLFVK